jgi:hypothetical protein
LVGYTPDRDYRYVEINRSLRALHPSVAKTVADGIKRAGGLIEPAADSLLRVNDEFTLSIVIARCSTTISGASRWHIHLDSGFLPDITVAIRMDADNSNILDYYLLPSLDMSMPRLRLAEANGVSLDCYRFDDLDYLFELAERVNLLEIACRNIACG